MPKINGEMWYRGGIRGKRLSQDNRETRYCSDRQRGAI